MEARIHPMYTNEFGPRVRVSLMDTRNTPDVYWSKNFNSYVLAEITLPPGRDRPLVEEEMDRYYFKDPDTGRWFMLVSVNGAGEIRWVVYADRLAHEEEYEEQCAAEGRPMNGDGVEFLAAARYFNLIPQ